MKQLFFLILCVIGFSAASNAQDQPTYDDLLMYFADGEYEKVVSKAEKYIGNTKSKNHYLPYFYSARANFEMSKDQKYDKDFPKAFNNAIGMAGKAIKKDKKGELFDVPQAMEFYTDLKTSIVEDIKNMVDAGDYSRLRGTVMKLQRMDPGDVGSHFLLCAAQYQIKDKGSAKITLKNAQLKLNGVESVEGWREIDFEMMRIGITEYSSYLVQMRQCDKAKELLNKVKQWFEEDEIFMAEYDEVVNGGC